MVGGGGIERDAGSVLVLTQIERDVWYMIVVLKGVQLICLQANFKDGTSHTISLIVSPLPPPHPTPMHLH